MKKVWYYLLYFMGFIILSYFSYSQYQSYMEARSEYFKIFPNIYYFSLSFFPIGLYFGLPQLLKTLRMTGTLRVNKTKLLVFGIPTLYLSLYPNFCYHFPLIVSHNIRLNQIIFSPELLTLPPFFLGFVLISCFTKQK
jgi:hypothetical protein